MILTFEVDTTQFGYKETADSIVIIITKSGIK